MNRMQNILERCLLECHSNLESSPHEAVAFPAIADILYGQHDQDVRKINQFINHIIHDLYFNAI